MGERQLQGDMATTSTAVATTVPAQLQEESEPMAVITLRQTRPKQRERKKVVWTEDTVDNEHMNKKKSKCCCIYEKPRKFGESDSEDSDDECEHCFGHVERRKMKHEDAATSAAAELQDGPTHEPTVETTLKPNQPGPAPAPRDNPATPHTS